MSERPDYLTDHARELLKMPPEWDSFSWQRMPEDARGGDCTHSLADMAREAGIYQHMWRPEELGITTAGQLTKPLTGAIIRLRGNPEHFKAFNPPNGWGDYHGFLQAVEQYRDACAANPDASIKASR